jgi:hypothetical protein
VIDGPDRVKQIDEVYSTREIPAEVTKHLQRKTKTSVVSCRDLETHDSRK